MSKEVLKCYKYIKSKPSSRVYPLLFSTSFSIFWMMAFSSSAIAQLNSSLVSRGDTSIPLTNQSENGVKTQNKDSIQDLENNFIQQTATPGASIDKKIPSTRTSEVKNQSGNNSLRSRALLGDLPTLAKQEVSQFELESPRQVKDSQSCNIGINCQQTNQVHQVQIRMALRKAGTLVV